MTPVPCPLRHPHHSPLKATTAIPHNRRPLSFLPPSSSSSPLQKSHTHTLFSTPTPLDTTTPDNNNNNDLEPEPTGRWAWFKKWWKKTAKIDRKKLAALGASAVCSYGLVSNINYCGTLCASYIIFARKYNISPLAPGQWKPFLTIYGGLWAAMNFLRPVRIWLALGLTPYFDKVVEKIRVKFQVQKSVALGITIFFVNVCGTFAFLGSALYASSVYTGVPIFPPK